MFAVNREDIYAVLSRQRIDQVAGNHHRFFVGQRNPSSLFNSRYGWHQTCCSHHGGHNAVARFVASNFHNAFYTTKDPARNHPGKAIGRFDTGQRHNIWVEFGNLSSKQLSI
jgi:hypothetical protein